ncbi:MAG TPA: hypothetical protein VMH32_12835 [Burkholderiales bacterium]|nr:hypothetical protein [Burkholderiales bacterium]
MTINHRTTVKTISGAAIAVAAAGLFLTQAAAPSAQAAEAKIHCSGVNACKGKSECAAASNSCKGQNACKGQGWVSMTEKACLDKGGKPEKD